MAKSLRSLPADAAYEWRIVLIRPEAAIEEAKRGLDRLEIEANPGVAAARTAGHAGVPVLVWRLDAPGQCYYLIPWQDERGILLIVQVDAQSGVMTSVAAPSAPLPRLTLAPKDAQHVASDRLGVDITGKPRLVWQPCREAPSPFLPLYEVPVNGGHIFVGMDGSVHRSLTLFGKGG